MIDEAAIIEALHKDINTLNEKIASLSYPADADAIDGFNYQIHMIQNILSDIELLKSPVSTDEKQLKPYTYLSKEQEAEISQKVASFKERIYPMQKYASYNPFFAPIFLDEDVITYELILRLQLKPLEEWQSFLGSKEITKDAIDYMLTKTLSYLEAKQLRTPEEREQYFFFSKSTKKTEKKNPFYPFNKHPKITYTYNCPYCNSPMEKDDSICTNCWLYFP